MLGIQWNILVKDYRKLNEIIQLLTENLLQYVCHLNVGVII